MFALKSRTFCGKFVIVVKLMTKLSFFLISTSFRFISVSVVKQ